MNNLNVSQQPCEEKSIGRVVCTRVAQSIWDCRVSPCFRALAIYLELVLAFENKVERSNECQCEDDDICFFPQTWVPND
jgi:hypothetical protein